MNRELEAEITQKIIELKNNKKTYREIKEFIKKEYGLDKSLNTLKKRYSTNKGKANFINSQGREYESFNADGSRELLRILELTDEQKESPDKIMLELGYNPLNWDLINLTLNVWQQNSVKKGLKNLYQVKVKLKPKEKEITQDDFIRIFENKLKTIKLKTFKPVKKHYKDDEFNDDLVMEISPDELHVGKKYLEDDTAEDRFYKKHQEVINTQSTYKAATAFVGFGNDVFNSEANQMTTAGTPQYNIMDFEDMYDLVCDIYINFFHDLRKHFKKIDVQLVRSNHGHDIDYMAYKLIYTAFKDDPTFNFHLETAKEETQVYEFGHCAIFNNHGDFSNGAPLQKFLKSLVNQFSNVFGRTKYRVSRLYHFHSVYAVDDEFGLEMTRGTSSSGIDKWHKTKRYLSRQRYNYYLWNKWEGEIARFYVNYETEYDKKKQLVKKYENKNN
jgi:hypothetical protein